MGLKAGKLEKNVCMVVKTCVACVVTARVPAWHEQNVLEMNERESQADKMVLINGS